jgi:hypothetical protein
LRRAFCTPQGLTGSDGEAFSWRRCSAEIEVLRCIAPTSAAFNASKTTERRAAARATFCLNRGSAENHLAGCRLTLLSASLVSFLCDFAGDLVGLLDDGR